MVEDKSETQQSGRLEGQSVNQAGLTTGEVRTIAANARKFIRDHPDITTPMPELGEDYAVQSDYYPRDLADGRERVPPKVGTKFDAHGIQNDSEYLDLFTLNYLLTQGIDPNREFHTMPLSFTGGASAFGAHAPYDMGGFIVIGHPNKMIYEEGIAGVIVNEHFYDVIPTLKERFPEIKFLKASDLADALEDSFDLNLDISAVDSK